MALNATLSCSPCGYEDTCTNAYTWCTYCEEGFCVKCTKVHRSTKMSRDHKLISVEEYEKITELIVNLNCKNHQKRCDLFCKKHDVGICVVCITSDHKDCDEIILIEEAAKNAKPSTALADLEAIISGMLNKLKCCINDRVMASIKIDKDEQLIKETIRDIRLSLDQRLDELEQILLLELKTKYERCKHELTKSVKDFELTEKEFESINRQITILKEFASDIQIFFVTRQANPKIKEKIVCIEEKMRQVYNYSLKVEPHPMIHSLLKDIQQFGKIKLNEETEFRSISLRLKQKFKLKEINWPITGCIILPNERIIVASYVDKIPLQEYDISGNHIRDIVVSSAPFDLTIIDTHHIAVTYGRDQFLENININTNCAVRKINFNGNCYGLSHQNGKLYVAVRFEGIVITDISGNILCTIKCNANYITTSTDRIYYTEYDSDSAYCCSMDGQGIWRFQDRSTSGLEGISLDNNRNVLVVSRGDDILRLIQHDGKESKILLNANDDLYNPLAVFHSKDKQIMCIGLKNGITALYRVA
ncbi:uncharacterized protein LOC134709940 [Mytilus trossulus]|uniref:uncharacterized protein LOC134709940 n=1 Tax=Mytilus trossulus TaxID=6551 RepID=UPI003005A3F8